MFFSSKKPYAKRPDRTSEGGDGVVTKQRAHRQMQSVIRTIITVKTSYLNFSEITFSDNHGVIKEKPTWRRGLIDDCSDESSERFVDVHEAASIHDPAHPNEIKVIHASSPPEYKTSSPRDIATSVVK